MDTASRSSPAQALHRTCAAVPGGRQPSDPGRLDQEFVPTSGERTELVDGTARADALATGWLAAVRHRRKNTPNPAKPASSPEVYVQSSPTHDLPVEPNRPARRRPRRPHAGSGQSCISSRLTPRGQELPICISGHANIRASDRQARSSTAKCPARILLTTCSLLLHSPTHDVEDDDEHCSRSCRTQDQGAQAHSSRPRSQRDLDCAPYLSAPRRHRPGSFQRLLGRVY